MSNQFSETDDGFCRRQLPPPPSFCDLSLRRVFSVGRKQYHPAEFLRPSGGVGDTHSGPIATSENVKLSEIRVLHDSIEVREVCFHREIQNIPLRCSRTTSFDNYHSSEFG